MSQTAAYLADQVIPYVPVRQRGRVGQLLLPIPLRVLLAAQPEPVTPVLQRVVERHLLNHAGLESDEGQGDAVTLIQRFGSAAELNIHLHGLVLDSSASSPSSSTWPPTVASATSCGSPAATSTCPWCSPACQTRKTGSP
jgi:hypothetical protein